MLGAVWEVSMLYYYMYYWVVLKTAVNKNIHVTYRNQRFKYSISSSSPGVQQEAHRFEIPPQAVMQLFQDNNLIAKWQNAQQPEYNHFATS